jgi:hypothetical protein
MLYTTQLNMPGMVEFVAQTPAPAATGQAANCHVSATLSDAIQRLPSFVRLGRFLDGR